MDHIKYQLIKITSTLLLITTFVAMTPFCKAVGWSPDNQLTTDPAWDFMPSVMQSRDGAIWVFWASDRRLFQYDLFYTTSSDYGSSWSNATRLTSDLGNDEGPSVMQSRDGAIWVFWASDRTGNKEIFYKTSSNKGATWSDDIQLTNNTSHDTHSSVTQNVDGKISVAWNRDLAGNYTIFYTASSDNGLTWSPEKWLTTDPSWDMNPSITSTGNGTLWVFWNSHRTDDNYEIFYKTSFDYGSSWSNATRLTVSSVEDTDPSALQDPAGTLWVFWVKDYVDIYYKTSTDFGENWSEDTLLVKSSGDDSNPSAANTKERKIWVVWESTRKDFDIYYKISDEIPAVHDIALTNITVWRSDGKIVTSAPQGTTLYVNVTVENQGHFQETFNVSVYAERNVGDVYVDIGTQHNVSLANGATTILTFTWDTAKVPYGTYYISAESTVVPDEYDTVDNFLIHGATLGGITAPAGNSGVSLFVMLAPLASVVGVVAAFGALAVAFFKLLMSIKPRRPWRRRRRQAK